MDLGAPIMSSITGSGRCYPYADGYRDSFSPAFTLNEKATVTLTVRTGGVPWSGRCPRARRRGGLPVWNGRNNAGRGSRLAVLLDPDCTGSGGQPANQRPLLGVGEQQAPGHQDRHPDQERVAVRLRRGQRPKLLGADRRCPTSTPRCLARERLRPYYSDKMAGAGYRFTLPPRPVTRRCASTATATPWRRRGSEPDSPPLGHRRLHLHPRDHDRRLQPLADRGQRLRRGLVSSSRVAEVTMYVPNYYSENDYEHRQGPADRHVQGLGLTAHGKRGRLRRCPVQERPVHSSGRSCLPGHHPTDQRNGGEANGRGRQPAASPTTENRTTASQPRVAHGQPLSVDTPHHPRAGLLQGEPHGAASVRGHASRPGTGVSGRTLRPRAHGGWW